MSGFDKIEFTPDKDKPDEVPVRKTPTDAKPAQHSSSRVIVGSTRGQSIQAKKEEKPRNMAKKKFKVSKKLPIILGIVIVSLALMGIPAYATYRSGLKTYRDAQLIAKAVKNQNIELASTEIEKTKKDLRETQKNLNTLFFLKFIPVANFYYNDADHLLKAGSHGLDSATIVVESIKPYADVLGLKGKGSFTAGSAEDRIRTAVMTTGKITPKIDEIAESLVLVKKEIDAVDPNHYPTFLFGRKIKSNLTTLRDTTDQGVTFVNDARPLVKTLPALLGEQKEKKYLVIFQNDKELRPTGGFITGYAIFRIDKGVIHLDKSGDIYDIDNSISNKPKAPAPILKYLPKVYSFNLRDSNISPDFGESMKTFRSMYETAAQKSNIDGIIALDTNVLVTTIKILDDSVTAGGITFNTKDDPRCDCPQVIYVLEDNISRPVNYVKSDRKSLIGDLLQAIMVKALSSSPKIYWGPLFQSLITQTSQKHVLFYVYDQDAQQGLDSLNAGGRIRETDGDYLHINQTNFSGAKVNIFMQEEVDNAYEVKGDGSIVKTVTIHYKNPYPPSDCNLERGGLCLNAEYRDWIRVYVPKGSELIDSKGSQVKVTTNEELGKTVFESFLTVRPKGIATYTLSYKLPFKLTSGSPLPVLIQKQPGTNGNTYTNIINGRKEKSFPLFTDTQSKLKI